MKQVRIFDISNKLPLEFSETDLNSLLEKLWEKKTVPDKLVCTMAQKRNISKFCYPIAMKRTLLDKLLFRVRYSDGSLKWSGHEGFILKTRLYGSDFGVIEIEAKK